MSVVYGLLLQAKGDVKRIKLKDSKSDEKLTEESLQTIIKKKTPLTNLGFYNNSGITLTLFGYTSGKAGTENKHELPPPLNEKTFYSDILLIASKQGGETNWSTPITYSPEQYEKFYQSTFGNTDHYDEDDEDDDDEDDGSLDKEEEDEVEEDEVIPSKKKKAAEEDGVPEDEEEDIPEDEEEGDEEEEEEVVDEEGVDEGEGPQGDLEGEEEVGPVKKSSSKKKTPKTNLTVVQNTGRANQQKFLTRPGFQSITSVGPIPNDQSKEMSIRTHVMKQIKHFLGTNFTQEKQNNLEVCIFRAALEDADTKFVVKHFDNKLFEICYMNSARRYIGNLSSKSYVQNTGLLQKVNNGDLTFETLASMTSMDLAPHIYTELRERQTLREQQQLEGNKSMATDMFKCGRCHKRETTFYELQTRSADEPMTKFITCVNCGNHWRM
jgi:transcription elongation factor S-II